MKKTLSIIIALVMLLGLAIPVSATAVATFTFTPDAESYNVGDTVSVAITVECTEEVNSIGLADFTFNTSALEFVAFNYKKSRDTVSKDAQFRTLDNANRVISLGYGDGDEDAYEGSICVATFTVKDGATAGDYTISATPVVKMGSDVKESTVVPATVTVASSGHVHTFGPWTYVDATNHKHVCTDAECSEEETEAHTWDSGVVTTPATHTAAGVKTYTCTVCGGTKTETIAKIAEHTYGEWTYVDATNHKKSCECGDEVTEAHSWNSGVVTTEATTKADGEKTYTCTVCGGTKTEVIPRIKVVLDANTDIEEVKDSYVNAAAKAITVDERTITGSNVFVTSKGQIRVDAGENAKIARENEDGTTSQGFVFGANAPSGIVTIVLQFEGIANEIDYTGKTVTRQFDFTGSEIYGLTNFGFAINNIPKPLIVTVK